MAAPNQLLGSEMGKLRDRVRVRGKVWPNQRGANPNPNPNLDALRVQPVGRMLHVPGGG